jgi:hypothetical protein
VFSKSDILEIGESVYPPWKQQERYPKIVNFVELPRGIKVGSSKVATGVEQVLETTPKVGEGPESVSVSLRPDEERPRFQLWGSSLRPAQHLY